MSSQAQADLLIPRKQRVIALLLDSASKISGPHDNTRSPLTFRIKMLRNIQHFLQIVIHLHANNSRDNNPVVLHILLCQATNDPNALLTLRTASSVVRLRSLRCSSSLVLDTPYSMDVLILDWGFRRSTTSIAKCVQTLLFAGKRTRVTASSTELLPPDWLPSTVSCGSST